MWSYIAGGVLLVLVIYFIVQGIRCSMAVKEGKSRLATYNAQTVTLSYGDMTYVDSGEGEVILSVHGIFGGYDQAYDIRIFAPIIELSLPHDLDIWEAMFPATEHLPNRQRRMWNFWTSLALTRCICWRRLPEAALQSVSHSIIRSAREA